jgi:hypothetical protein
MGRMCVMRRWVLGLSFGLFLGASARGAYTPPVGYQRTPHQFGGDSFAIAPNGEVAVGQNNFANGGATIKVYSNTAAAALGTSPIDTFTDPTFKEFGDLTFADNNTLLFTEDSADNTVYRGTVDTGSFSSLASTGSIPNGQGIAISGPTVYVAAANNPGTGTVYTVPLAGGSATASLTNIGTGYIGGIAIDSTGNLWVTDTNDPTFAGNAGKVLRFSSSLSPLSSIDLTGGNGSGAFDIIFDHDGDAFVSTGATLTKIAAGTSDVSQFGSVFGTSFPFVTGLDFFGNGFQPFNGTGQLFVNAGFADDGAIIGIQTPEPSTALLVVLPLSLLLFKRSRKVGAAILSIGACGVVRADNFFASQVISASAGTSQNAQFADTSKALGGPRGLGNLNGSLDVYNLGSGGSITVGFDDPGISRHITNGSGADFIVSENPFYLNGDPTTNLSFAELMFVEVSTDGTNFARYPVVSNTPSAVGPFTPINVTNVSGFGGVHPVYANVDTNTISPFDPTVAGGDAFDLSALATNSLVTGGQVDLNDIRFVRLVDVIGDGTSLDSNGHAIFDPTGSGSNGADVDAISVINGVVVPEPVALSSIVALTLLSRRKR